MDELICGDQLTEAKTEKCNHILEQHVKGCVEYEMARFSILLTLLVMCTADAGDTWGQFQYIIHTLCLCL